MGKMTATALPSKSPTVWGPPTWQMLHYFASGYPHCPTPPVQQHCVAFLKALPWMLPCETCGAHCRSFLLGYPGGPEAASRCHDALTAFVLALHNDVAAHTRPLAEPWTPEQAALRYASGVVVNPGARSWSDGARLVREQQGTTLSSKQRFHRQNDSRGRGAQSHRSSPT